MSVCKKVCFIYQKHWDFWGRHNVYIYLYGKSKHVSKDKKCFQKNPYFDTRLSSWVALGVSRLAQLWDIAMEWELLAEWILSHAGVDILSDTLEFSDRKASNCWFSFKPMLFLCCILFLVLNMLSILFSLVQRTRLLKRASHDLSYINTSNISSFWYVSLILKIWDISCMRIWDKSTHIQEKIRYFDSCKWS